MNKIEKRNIASLRQSSSTYIIISFVIWILSAAWGFIKDMAGLDAGDGTAIAPLVKTLNGLGTVIYLASFVLLFMAFRAEKTAYALEKNGGKNPFNSMTKLVIAFPVLSVVAALGYFLVMGVKSATTDLSPEEINRTMAVMLAISKPISDLFAITNVVGIFSFKIYRFEKNEGREGSAIAKLAFLGAVMTALDLVVGVASSVVSISSITNMAQTIKTLPRYLTFTVTMLMCIFQLLLYYKRRMVYKPSDESAYNVPDENN